MSFAEFTSIEIEYEEKNLANCQRKVLRIVTDSSFWRFKAISPRFRRISSRIKSCLYPTFTVFEAPMQDVEGCFSKWMLPRWCSYRVKEVRSVAVQGWLRSTQGEVKTEPCGFFALVPCRYLRTL